MKKNKSISVIIPLYNARNSISRTIDSLMRQKLPFLEIIIIDDCSTDGGAAYIKAKYYNRVTILRNNKNKGAAYTRNRGFRSAKGGVILFIDSDVTMQKNSLRYMLSLVEDNHIVFPFMKYANNFVMYPNSKQDEQYLLVSPCFMITREGVSKMNNSFFDEQYRIYCEDTDFFLRCYLNKLRCGYAKKAVVIHETNKEQFRDERYFRELKNSLYGFVKFYGFRLQAFDHAFRIRNIIQLLACGFFNFNLFDAQVKGYDKSKSALYKIQKLFIHKEKITDKGILFIFYLTLRALIEGARMFPQAYGARKNLQMAVNNTR